MYYTVYYSTLETGLFPNEQTTINSINKTITILTPVNM